MKTEVTWVRDLLRGDDAIRDILLYFLVLSLLVLQAIRQYIIEVTPSLWCEVFSQFSTWHHESGPSSCPAVCLPLLRCPSRRPGDPSHRRQSSLRSNPRAPPPSLRPNPRAPPSPPAAASRVQPPSLLRPPLLGRTPSPSTDQSIDVMCHQHLYQRR